MPLHCVEVFACQPIRVVSTLLGTRDMLRSVRAMDMNPNTSDATKPKSHTWSHTLGLIKFADQRPERRCLPDATNNKWHARFHQITVRGDRPDQFQTRRVERKARKVRKVEEGWQMDEGGLVRGRKEQRFVDWKQKRTMLRGLRT